jgi:hypothetical protein
MLLSGTQGAAFQRRRTVSGATLSSPASSCQQCGRHAGR